MTRNEKKIAKLLTWIGPILINAIIGAILFDRTLWLMLWGGFGGMVIGALHDPFWSRYEKGYLQRLDRKRSVVTPGRHDLSLKRRPR